MFKTNWDDELNQEHTWIWKDGYLISIKQILSLYKDICLPKERRLRKCLDACVYAVYTTESGVKLSTLVTGKSRVAPVKGISKKYYWTDSLNALYWINATKDLKQFVDNRAESTRSNAVVCLETGDLHQVLTILPILHLEEHILQL